MKSLLDFFRNAICPRRFVFLWRYIAGTYLASLWTIHFTIGVTAAARSSSRSGFIVISSASIASNVRASMITLTTWMAASKMKMFLVVCAAAISGGSLSTAA